MTARLACASLVLVAVIALAALGTGAVAAEPDPACAGSGGGAMFVADSGFTVAYNDTQPMPEDGPFLGPETIRFRNVTFSSNASTVLGVENGTGPTTCLFDIDATNGSVLIAPDDEANVSVDGTVPALSLSAVTYGSGSGDIAYDAAASWNLTLLETGLESGADVDAVAENGSTLASGTVTENGTLPLALPGGTNTVDLQENSGGGGGFLPPPPPDDDGSPPFDVTALTLDHGDVGVGEQVAVTIEVENVGESDGTFTGTLTADGERVDSGSIAVESNGAGTLTLTTTFDEPGTYELAVDGEPAGSVTVTDESALSIPDASIEPSDVDPGETVRITVTVAAGETGVDRTLVLSVDGDEVDSASVSLSPDESRTVTFEHRFDSTGSKTVSVDGVDVGSVTVAHSDEGAGGPPLVIVASVLGVLLAVGIGSLYWYDPERFAGVLNR
ncbi:CARDB domain-containing protein [Halovivax cerinus]|uniref:CARDB domain-containing protein n=1 Tax=Halovivax cerinus TaxID=1487865 RepID=A0ABD5NP33_9EURY|nr:CARDB domain-containing protein [Halovivax cerinus]